MTSAPIFVAEPISLGPVAGSSWRKIVFVFAFILHPPVASSIGLKNYGSFLVSSRHHKNSVELASPKWVHPITVVEQLSVLSISASGSRSFTCGPRGSEPGRLLGSRPTDSELAGRVCQRSLVYAPIAYRIDTSVRRTVSRIRSETAMPTGGARSCLSRQDWLSSGC